MKIFVKILFLALVVGTCGISLKGFDPVQQNLQRQRRAQEELEAQRARAAQARQRAFEEAEQREQERIEAADREGLEQAAQARAVRLAAYRQLAQSGEKKWQILPFSKINEINAKYGPLLELSERKTDPQDIINDLSIDLFALRDKGSNFAMRLKKRLKKLQDILQELFNLMPRTIRRDIVEPEFEDYESFSYADYLPLGPVWQAKTYIPKAVRYRYLHSREYRELQTIKKKYAPLMRLLVVDMDNKLESTIKDSRLKNNIEDDIRALNETKDSWLFNALGMRTSSINLLIQRLNDLLSFINERVTYLSRVISGPSAVSAASAEATATGGSARQQQGQEATGFTGGIIINVAPSPSVPPASNIPPVSSPGVPGAGVGGSDLGASTQGGLEASESSSGQLGESRYGGMQQSNP